MKNKEIEKELEDLEILIYLATQILKDAIDLQAIAYKEGNKIRIAKLEEAVEVFENRLYMHNKRRDELFSQLLGENENE